jgi:beta-glucanase (GH16 family)
MQQMFSKLLPFVLIIFSVGCANKTKMSVKGLRSTTASWDDTTKPGWVLTFHDEFNAGKLDGTKWATLPYHGSRYHPDNKFIYWGENNIEFTQNSIKLIARKEITKIDSIELPYTIGWIENMWVMDQLYGYFEIRCKMPEGKGMWPAFWLVSRHSWPPEVDIFEIYTSKNPRILESNIHYLVDGRHLSKMKKTKIPDPREDFHIYGFEWQPELMIWYFDYQPIRRQVIKPEWFNHPMHIAINTMIDVRRASNIAETTLPNYFEVDYVRAYKKIHPTTQNKN